MHQSLANAQYAIILKYPLGSRFRLHFEQLKQKQTTCQSRHLGRWFGAKYLGNPGDQCIPKHPKLYQP